MPCVSCVIRIPVKADKTPHQVLDEMKKKLKVLGSERVCSTQIESSVYLCVNDRASGCHSFQVITYSEYPATCFVYTDNGIELTCDLAFREFPGLLKGVFEHEKKQQVDGVGDKYRLGDFEVNFISLCLGQSKTIKVLLLEITFTPAFRPHQCIDLLRNFLRQYFPEVCPCESTFTNTLSNAIRLDSSDSSPSAQLLASARPEQLITGERIRASVSRSALLSVSQFVEQFSALR